MADGRLRRGELILILVLLAAGGIEARAGEPDMGENGSFLPLLDWSTYTYNFTFKERKGSETLVVQPAARAGVVGYYFAQQSEAANPDTLIGIATFGRGLYVKKDGAIGTVECFMKKDVSAIKLDAPTMIIKNPPKTGDEAELSMSTGNMKITCRIEGNEDVTAPAGTFKDCLKIKTEEIHTKQPPEKNIVYTGCVWLAKGVGVVKWQRETGRVDELVSYKLAEQKKEATK